MSRITNADIMRATEAALNRGFPDEPVYWDRLPKDFKRPCFTVECQQTKSSDVSAELVQRGTTILVTCLAAADGYGDSSREELTLRQERVMGLFSAGKFPVLDRHLSVNAAEGEQTPELAAVSAFFSWVDGRSEYPDPEAPDTGVPRMENYKINEEEVK